MSITHETPSLGFGVGVRHYAPCSYPCSLHKTTYTEPHLLSVLIYSNVCDCSVCWKFWTTWICDPANHWKPKLHIRYTIQTLTATVLRLCHSCLWLTTLHQIFAYSIMLLLFFAYFLEVFFRSFPLKFQHWTVIFSHGLCCNLLIFKFADSVRKLTSF
jgi:hypothetical protein